MQLLLVETDSKQLPRSTTARRGISTCHVNRRKVEEQLAIDLIPFHMLSHVTVAKLYTNPVRARGILGIAATGRDLEGGKIGHVNGWVSWAFDELRFD